MSLKTIGQLIPRDFLDRQPKRWQKSQRKRRVVGFLTKIKAKRDALEERELKKRVIDDLGGIPKAPVRVERPVPLDAEDADAAAHGLKASTSTPIGPHAQGLWAAHLAPNQALVVKIPAGVQLCLLRASLCDLAAGSTGRATMSAARSAVRCRTPAKKVPTTLCYLQPELSESCSLAASFGERDKLCAIAVEGIDAVHLHAAPAARPAGTAAVVGAPGTAGAPAGLTELGGGLKYIDIKVGKGRRVVIGNKLTVRYTGACADARGQWAEFDSNGGKPFHFTVGQGDVIRGWDVGLLGMAQGSTRRLVVPASYGYGARGAGPVLPNRDARLRGVLAQRDLSVQDERHGERMGRA
ncbi:peptidyl-prolyl cis-trans isomerase [Chrysochromulina tobinii]|uniref:peptidylprolyl isomerase n=1 Tax=Chrysochromulina tobinii TaxID=1460289 RepID=A0A0M0JZX4_9EUKA|nr:peptidyl-prolyl cis-trans isomerase [Chrysochromulina tobinii]|eukprot:KOO32105.1 peptidyl-prolyl cis-trans isomerase [Chrysochromulina sp. CCMP291]